MGLYKDSPGKLSLKLRSSNDEAITESLGYVNYDAYKDQYDSDVAACNITLARSMSSIANLTRNSYLTNRITYEFYVEED